MLSDTALLSAPAGGGNDFELIMGHFWPGHMRGGRALRRASRNGSTSPKSLAESSDDAMPSGVPETLAKTSAPTAVPLWALTRHAQRQGHLSNRKPLAQKYLDLLLHPCALSVSGHRGARRPSSQERRRRDRLPPRLLHVSLETTLLLR